MLSPLFRKTLKNHKRKATTSTLTPIGLTLDSHLLLLPPNFLSLRCKRRYQMIPAHNKRTNMKHITLFSAITIALLSACGNPKTDAKNEAPAKDTTLSYFGDTITTDGAVAAEQLVAQMHGKDSVKIKLTGRVDEVCQKKGCWMTMNIGNNKTMQIRFKDYGFFVPKDAPGKTAFIEGVAFTDTTSVADLQHYAEDAGKSKAEIAKITEPEVNLSFEANGVIIKK